MRYASLTVPKWGGITSAGYLILELSSFSAKKDFLRMDFYIYRIAVSSSPTLFICNGQ